MKCGVSAVLAYFPFYKTHMILWAIFMSDVTLVTVPNETLASRSVFVTEASAIRAPTVYSLLYMPQTMEGC